MINSLKVDPALLQERLADVIRKELTAAAEPLIQSALKTAEAEMRRRLAAVLVGQIESSYDLVQNGQLLTIRVRLDS
jgi:hypothetical protein